MHSLYRAALPQFVAIQIVIIAALTPVSNAALVITFDQRGSDVVVVAQGALDLRGFDWTWSAWEMNDAYYRQLGGNLPQDLVRIFRDSVAAYEFDFGVDLFAGGLPVQVADVYSGQTFGMWTDGSIMQVYVPRNFVSGLLEGSMTFRGVDLSSLGVIEQTIELGGVGASSIEIKVVPEPRILLFFLPVLTMLACKRQRACPCFTSDNVPKLAG